MIFVGLLWQLFKGIVHGRPSLDIQLIRATSILSSILKHRQADNHYSDHLIYRRNDHQSSHTDIKSKEEFNRQDMGDNIPRNNAYRQGHRRSDKMNNDYSNRSFIRIDYLQTIESVRDLFSNRYESSHNTNTEGSHARPSPSLTMSQFAINRQLFHLVLITIAISFMVIFFGLVICIWCLVFPSRQFIAMPFQSDSVSLSWTMSITIQDGSRYINHNRTLLPSTRIISNYSEG